MSKVSQATLIGLGLVGPKVKPKGVIDGQQVNIPVPLVFRQSNTGPILIPIFFDFGWRIAGFVTGKWR